MNKKINNSKKDSIIEQPVEQVIEQSIEQPIEQPVKKFGKKAKIITFSSIGGALLIALTVILIVVLSAPSLPRIFFNPPNTIEEMAARLEDDGWSVGSVETVSNPPITFKTVTSTKNSENSTIMYFDDETTAKNMFNAVTAIFILMDGTEEDGKRISVKKVNDTLYSISVKEYNHTVGTAMIAIEGKAIIVYGNGNTEAIDL